tara:strand:+ start:1024 stop:1149 length:126 start_codon:yes stop_codon:yes gene_type:complete
LRLPLIKRVTSEYQYENYIIIIHQDPNGRILEIELEELQYE